MQYRGELRNGRALRVSLSGRRGRRRGATLLELMIVMALMGILIGSLGFIMQACHTYYFGSIESLDLQQKSLVGMSHLSRELSETSILAVHRYDDPLPTDPDPPGPPAPPGAPPRRVNSGLVFASPRDTAGNYVADVAGRVQWQTFVCIYLQQINGRSTLVRKVTPVPSGPKAVIPDPDQEGRGLAYFKTSSDNLSVLGTGIIRFQTQINSDTVSVLTNAKVSGRYEFQLETQTTILPRN